MVAYVDSSVILRFVLQQPDAARELIVFEQRITSMFAEVECMCAVDAAWARGDLDEEQWGDRRAAAHRQLRRMRRLMPSRSILRRATEPLPVPLRSLDALHLASALSWRDRHEPDLVFATHDHRQALAARSLGFEVLGV